MQKNAADAWSLCTEVVFFVASDHRCSFRLWALGRNMAEELSELEARIFEWIRQSDFENVPWSTAKAARSFKVKQDEVYEAVAALTRKVPDRIQVFYKDGSVHIAAE